MIVTSLNLLPKVVSLGRRHIAMADAAWSRRRWSCYKSIIGDRLHARHDAVQRVEVAIGISILNRMMNLSKPISVRGA